MTGDVPGSFFIPLGLAPLAISPDPVSHQQNHVYHDPDREKADRGAVSIGAGICADNLGLGNRFIVQDG